MVIVKQSSEEIDKGLLTNTSCFYCRSVHVSNHHQMISLPMDLLMHNKVSQESVLRELDSESMRNVAFDIASRANSHLQKVKLCFKFILSTYIS